MAEQRRTAHRGGRQDSEGRRRGEISHGAFEKGNSVVAVPVGNGSIAFGGKI